MISFEQMMWLTTDAVRCRYRPVLRRLFPLALAVAMGAVPVLADEPPTADLLDFKTIRSRSRRFVAVSRDAKQGLDVIKWTETVADKVERMTGLRWSAKPWWSLNVSIRNETGAASNRVYTTQSFEHGHFAQRLVVNNYQAADVRDTEEKLCRLLFNAAVVRAQVGTEEGGVSHTALRSLRESGQLHVAPAWLARGLSQNLHRSTRSTNSRIAVERRAGGELPALGAFLGARPERTAPLPDDPAVCGLVVGWLISLPSERRVFPLFVERLAAGRTISPEWVAGTVARCASAAELETIWDAWVDRQKRTVYDPGETAYYDLRMLDVELLLSAGASGIPLENMPRGEIRPREMVEYRNAPWISAFAVRKSAELRVLAVARSPEFVQVVEHYCRFLAALKNRRGEQELKRALDVAEAAYEALRRQVMAERGEGRDGPGRQALDEK